MTAIKILSNKLQVYVCFYSFLKFNWIRLEKKRREDFHFMKFLNNLVTLKFCTAWLLKYVRRLFIIIYERVNPFYLAQCSISTPRENVWKLKVFWHFLGGIEMDHWAKMGNGENFQTLTQSRTMLSFIQVFQVFCSIAAESNKKHWNKRSSGFKWTNCKWYCFKKKS